LDGQDVDSVFPSSTSSSSSSSSLVPQDAVTRRGLTALHLAVLNGHSQV
jgi:ankyrin repeat protein